MRVGQETGQTNRLRNGSIFTVKNLAGSTSFWREASRRWRSLFSIGS
jgi:hypothetical protein